MLRVLSMKAKTMAELMACYEGREGWMWEWAVQESVRLTEESLRMETMEGAQLDGEMLARLEGENPPDQPALTRGLIRTMVGEMIALVEWELTEEERQSVYARIGSTVVGQVPF